jgi:hypothetical protein
MATLSSDSSKASGRSSTVGGNFSKWLDVKPKVVVAEDAMGEMKVRETWRKMMAFAGMRSPTEQEQVAFRAGIYTYACLNGTSREGNYETDFQLANGQNISASVIPRATGKYNIRKFFRGNMMEAYEFLKSSHIMEDYERFIAKCAAMGISSSEAFATADFLDDCPMFTPAEAKAHEISLTYGLNRARLARGGNLESVEQKRLEKVLESNGPSEAENGHSMKF